jgi:hypothetical protein
VSLSSETKSLSSGGMTRRMRLGQHHVAQRLPGGQAQRARGGRWLGCTDRMPAQHLGDVGRVGQDDGRGAEDLDDRAVTPVRLRAGTPKPMSRITSSVGTPRNRST